MPHRLSRIRDNLHPLLGDPSVSADDVGLLLRLADAAHEFLTYEYGGVAPEMGNRTDEKARDLHDALAPLLAEVEDGG